MSDPKKIRLEEKPSDTAASAAAVAPTEVPIPKPDAPKIAAPPPPARKKDELPSDVTVLETQSDAFVDMVDAALSKVEPLGADGRRRLEECIPVRPDLTEFQELITTAANRVAIQNSRMLDNRDTPAKVESISKACWYTFYRACVYWEATIRPNHNHMRPNLLLLPMEVSFAIQLLRPFAAKNTPTLFVDPAWVESWMERAFPNSGTWRYKIDISYNWTLAVCGGQSRTMCVMKPNLENLTSILTNTVYKVKDTEDGSEIVMITGPVVTDLESMFVCLLKFWTSRLFDGYFDPHLSESNSKIRPLLSTVVCSHPIDWRPKWHETTNILQMAGRDGTTRSFY